MEDATPESYESRTQGGLVSIRVGYHRVSRVEQVLLRLALHVKTVCHGVVCLNPKKANDAWG